LVIKTTMWIYFDGIIAKAAKIINNSCPDTCSCYNSGNHPFEHWLLECPMFKYHRFKFHNIIDTLLNSINLSNNVNLSNNNCNYNSNSIVENKIDNSSSNNINDFDNIIIY